MPDGSAPTETFRMNASNTFSFSKRAGLDGYALPRFRALNYAYLRDHMVLDARVSAILPAPCQTGRPTRSLGIGFVSRHSRAGRMLSTYRLGSPICPAGVVWLAFSLPWPKWPRMGMGSP